LSPKRQTDGTGAGAVVGWCVGAIVSAFAGIGAIASSLGPPATTGPVTNALIGGGVGGLVGAIGGAATSRLRSYLASRRR
jgi:hypothetical protein